MDVTAAVLAILLAAGEKGTAASEKHVPAGEWTGLHARLDVQEGSARVELDCAHGTIDGALRLDRNDRFKAKGRFQFEGGAEFAQETPDGRPAEYSGKLKNEILTIRIVTEDRQKLGPFTLELGGQAGLVKCQ